MCLCRQAHGAGDIQGNCWHQLHACDQIATFQGMHYLLVSECTVQALVSDSNPGMLVDVTEAVLP